MIYSLEGTLKHREPGLAVISCGGVGYRCAVSMNTAMRLPSAGSPAFLFTHMHIRDDALDLFGFIDTAELSCFRLLISVSGVGPKAALAILSEMPADKAVLCIASGDAKSLTRAAGVGMKLAQRIVLELKDKLVSADVELPESFSELTTSVSGGRSALNEAVNALAALGYSRSEAVTALKGAPDNASVEDLIKIALKNFAG